MKTVADERYVKKPEVLIHINLMYACFIPLIFIGKLIRWTFMRHTLVDAAIGHIFIQMALVDGDFSLSEEGPGPVLASLTVFFNNVFGVYTLPQFEIIVTIIWNIMLFMLLLNLKKHLTIVEAAFVAWSIIVLNTFAFTLSKEPVQMLYFILIYIVLCNEKISGTTKWILTVGVLLLSTFTFRRYFGLIALFMGVAQLAIPIIARKKINTIVVLVVLLLGCSLIYYLLLELGPYLPFMNDTQYSELLRVRQQPDRVQARTIISASTRVDTFPWMAINYFLILLRLMFPFELLPFGVQFFPYFLFQLTITGIFLKCLASYRENTKTVNLAMLVYLGFMATSGAYQPDFGSWIRHSSVLFPVFLVMMKIKTIKNMKEA